MEKQKTISVEERATITSSDKEETESLFTRNDMIQKLANTVRSAYQNYSQHQNLLVQ